MAQAAEVKAASRGAGSYRGLGVEAVVTGLGEQVIWRGPFAQGKGIGNDPRRRFSRLDPAGVDRLEKMEVAGIVDSGQQPGIELLRFRKAEAGICRQGAANGLGAAGSLGIGIHPVSGEFERRIVAAVPVAVDDVQVQKAFPGSL